jgi:peptide deformylase
MVHDLVFWPSPKLTEKSTPVLPSQFGSDWLKQLAEDLIDTAAHYEGVGLSAPQLGVPTRVILVPGEKNEPLVLVNPVIIERAPEVEEQVEGCLSLPGVRLPTKRAKWVKLQAQKLDDGAPYETQVDGISAIAVQHETEHLDGRTIADDCGPVKRTLLKAKVEKNKRGIRRFNERREAKFNASGKEYRMRPKTP